MKRRYLFKVCFGDGRYADGVYEVEAGNLQEATDTALEEICAKLYSVLPELDIEVTVEEYKVED